MRHHERSLAETKWLKGLEFFVMTLGTLFCMAGRYAKKHIQRA